MSCRSDATGEADCPDKGWYCSPAPDSPGPDFGGLLPWRAACCRGTGAICSFRIQLRRDRLGMRTISAWVWERPPP